MDELQFFRLSVMNNMWDRKSSPDEIISALMLLNWNVNEYCAYLDQLHAEERTLSTISVLVEAQLAEFGKEAEARFSSKVMVEDIYSAVAEFAFRYMTRYFPLVVSIGSVNLYELPEPGEFIQSCTSGLECDNELLHEDAFELFFEPAWQHQRGGNFDRYFERLKPLSSESRRQRITKRFPIVARQTAEHILCEGIEHTEAYYRLLDVSGMRVQRTRKVAEHHPNTFDLIASDICLMWDGYDELVELFSTGQSPSQT